MELTERKKKVLRSVVDLYIRTAEPVGSKLIAELPDMQYSSATIRSEMADLLAMGYLEQPHTSAGRIPSAAGYRLYVDELMADYRLSIDETKSINTAIEEKMQRVDKLVEKVAKLVSQATDLPAISMASRSAEAVVKRFELIQAGAGSFILVVMLSNDEVVNKLIKLPLHVEENDLKVLSALLNATMTELSAEEFYNPRVLQNQLLRERNSSLCVCKSLNVMLHIIGNLFDNAEEALPCIFSERHTKVGKVNINCADIRRTFMYHGAEHKTIFCYEAGLPLTVENVRPQPRNHPRCGTSFLFVVIFVLNAWGIWFMLIDK